MNILFVTAHKYIPETLGGMEVNTHQLCLQLLKHGHQVGVLASLAGRGLQGIKSRLKIKLLKNNCPKDNNLGYPVWRTWNTLDYTNYVATEFKPNIVIVQGGHLFYDIISNLLDINLPVVAYLHTPDRLTLPEKFKTNKQLSFIANSQFTTSLHHDKRIDLVIPPIVPKESYVTISNKTTAVFINPSKYKGQDIVLAIAKARPDVNFIFVSTHSAQSLEISNS